MTAARTISVTVLAVTLLSIQIGKAADEPAPSTQAAQQPGRAWIWCGLRGATGTGYIGDVHPRYNATKYRIWSDSSRFLRAVNSTYGEHLEGSGGICQSYHTEMRAEAALSDFRIGLQREGRDIIVVGVF